MRMCSMPAMDLPMRITRLREAAALEASDSLYVTASPNIRYLSGFHGSAGVLVVTARNAILITDGRYEEVAREQCQSSGVEIIAEPSDQHSEIIGKILSGSKRLLLDPGQISMDAYSQLKSSLPDVDIAYARQIIEHLRLTKDAGEIARIRAACGIALQAFEQVSGWLAEHIAERSIAHRLEALMKELGAEDIAFSTIVASGPNSAKPHHQPGERVPEEGEPVIIDFGAVVDGYCSDITRTVWIGELRGEYRPMYEAAVAAHAAGIEGIRAGVSHSDVDAVCRRTFENLGFKDKPLHPSGHNVGLSIHERPFLASYASEAIGAGYVLTVEPGLYRPGVGGFRVEDTLLAQESRSVVLSSSARTEP